MARELGVFESSGHVVMLWCISCVPCMLNSGIVSEPALQLALQLRFDRRAQPIDSQPANLVPAVDQLLQGYGVAGSCAHCCWCALSLAF